MLHSVWYLASFLANPSWHLTTSLLESTASRAADCFSFLSFISYVFLMVTGCACDL